MVDQTDMMWEHQKAVMMDVMKVASWEPCLVEHLVGSMAWRLEKQ